MPTYLSPGVYVEEVESGSRPIEGVGTAVAAFVGIAADGPFHTPTLISSWTQFTSVFGDFVADSYLAHAVYGYFLNGGGNCYVVRIGGGPAKASANGSSDGKRQSADQRAALAAGAPQGQVGRLKFVALEAGTRSGEITVDVAEAGGDSPGEDMFKLVVKRDGQQVEEFDRATLGKGRQNVLTMVNNSSKVIRLEEVP